MSVTERYAEVIWRGHPFTGAGTLTGESGAFGALPISAPSRMGPVDGHTTPEELLASAHAGCYAMALGFLLDQRGTAANELRVRVRYALEMVDNTFRIATAHLDVGADVEGIGEEDFQSVAKEAEGLCPVSNAVRGNVEIVLTATSKH